MYLNVCVCVYLYVLYIYMHTVILKVPQEFLIEEIFLFFSPWDRGMKLYLVLVLISPHSLSHACFIVYYYSLYRFHLNIECL